MALAATVVLGVVTALSAGAGTALAQTGSEDGPGSLVRAEPTTAFALPGVPAPVRAWSMLYRSVSATGEPNEVSGTVLVPPGEWSGEGERPVVSYAIGTHGLGDRCAPSALLAGGTEQEYALMQQALARGWAVAVTDYEGLGTPGPHTYVVAQSEGHAVLDAARAAFAVPGAGLDADAPVGIWGYSQGGGAAGKAAEQAARYAPDLDVVGVAAGGVPGRLDEVFEANQDNNLATGLVAAATLGLEAAYPELDLGSLLTRQGRELRESIRNDCTGELAAKGAPFTIRGLSAVPDPLGGDDVRARIAQNQVGGGIDPAPQAPALVYHAGLDELIPVNQGRTLREQWCARGTRVQYLEVPATEHVTGAIAGAPAAVAWLGDRFAGRPSPSSC